MNYVLSALSFLKSVDLRFLKPIFWVFAFVFAFKYLKKSLGIVVGDKQIKEDIAKELNFSNAFSSDRIVADTIKIAERLGVVYSWWNPQSWTEDEHAVLVTLSDYDRDNFSVLLSSYLRKYNRNLVEDLYSYLSTDEIQYIERLWR